MPPGFSEPSARMESQRSHVVVAPHNHLVKPAWAFGGGKQRVGLVVMAGHGQRRRHEWRAGESGAYLAAGFAHQAGESIAGLHAAHRFAVKQSEGDGERVGALGVGCHGAVKVGETLQESINHTVTQGGESSFIIGLPRICAMCVPCMQLRA